MGLSGFAKFWLVVSALICIIDATFVILRPRTLKGGDLGDTQPWPTWQHYATFDKRYGDMKDGWVVLQSYLNYFEIVLSFLAVGANSVKLGLVVSIIYFGMEHFEGGKYTHHNSTQDLLLMMIIPSMFWIVIPAFVAKQCLDTLLPRPVSSPDRKRK